MAGNVRSIHRGGKVLGSLFPLIVVSQRDCPEQEAGLWIGRVELERARELNQRGAKYIVVGGFAIRAAGYNRRTMDAVADADVRHIGDVPIPFASPRLLWRMKRVTHREKDAGDLVFLPYWFSERGETPPA